MYNVNGKSVWIEGGKVTDTKQINRYFNVSPIKTIEKTPEEKAKEEKLKNEKQNPPPQPEKEKPVVLGPGPKNPTPEQAPEKANLIVDSKEVNKLALVFKTQFKGKDGGSEKDPNAQYKMPDSFFKAWATAYLQYGK